MGAGNQEPTEISRWRVGFNLVNQQHGIMGTGVAFRLQPGKRVFQGPVFTGFIRCCSGAGDQKMHFACAPSHMPRRVFPLRRRTGIVEGIEKIRRWNVFCNLGRY